MNITLIKQLRDETGISIADIKQALEDANNDIQKAKTLLKERGLEKATKKAGRSTEQGVVASYIHVNGTIGSLVTLACETDFVARTKEFTQLAQEVAMQVAAMNPESVDDLLRQAYIRDNTKTIGDLIQELIAKLGENIQIRTFSRQSI